MIMRRFYTFGFEYLPTKKYSVNFTNIGIVILRAKIKISRGTIEQLTTNINSDLCSPYYISPTIMIVPIHYVIHVSYSIWISY